MKRPRAAGRPNHQRRVNRGKVADTLSLPFWLSATASLISAGRLSSPDIVSLSSFNCGGTPQPIGYSSHSLDTPMLRLNYTLNSHRLNKKQPILLRPRVAHVRDPTAGINARLCGSFHLASIQAAPLQKHRLPKSCSECTSRTHQLTVR